jgi:hypothetical protein
VQRLKAAPFQISPTIAFFRSLLNDAGVESLDQACLVTAGFRFYCGCRTSSMTILLPFSAVITLCTGTYPVRVMSMT